MTHLATRFRPLLLVACLLAVPAVAGAAPFTTGDIHAKKGKVPKSRSLVGSSSQQPCQMEPNPLCGNVNLLLTRSRRSVKRFAFAYEARCGAAGTYLSQLLVSKQFSVNGRRFAGAGHLELPLDEGLVGGLDITLKGKLTRTRTAAHGVFRVIAHIKNTLGQPIDTCDTGRVTWTVAAD
jgi:hypothetical protein